MRRRDGGRRRLPEEEAEAGAELEPEPVPLLGPAEAFAGVEAEVEVEVEAEGAVGAVAGAGDGVAARDLVLALVRSIHGFSGGTRGTVYWATAERDMSHLFGAQTPTRTRQAATRRLALQRGQIRTAEQQNMCQLSSGKAGGVRLRREAHSPIIRVCVRGCGCAG